MTISTTASRIAYNGNNATTVFSFPYRFLANGDLVVVEVSSAGVETTKTLTTHYTLTGAGNDAGGSVTMLTAPAAGTRLVIYRDTDITQETDYISGDPFPAETHERALDKLTMIAQEVGSDADRAIKVPVGDSSSLTTTLPAAADRLDKFLVFDATTGATELSTVTQTQVVSAVSAAYAAGSTADAISYTPEGTGYQVRTVQARLRDILIDDDYATFANAKTKADAALLPLFADPTVNLELEPPLGGGAVPCNGYLKKGYYGGHLAIGNNNAGIDATVGIRGDELYTNVEQEVRGVSYVLRNTRTTADEPTLGWDFFGVAGVVEVPATNTQNIVGLMKGVVSELYFRAPSAGSYSVLTAYNYQATLGDVGAGATVTSWYGLVVTTAPATGAGTLTNAYGIYIQQITATNAAAIQIGATGDGSRIKWPDAQIKQNASQQLEIAGNTYWSSGNVAVGNVPITTAKFYANNVESETASAAYGGFLKVVPSNTSGAVAKVGSVGKATPNTGYAGTGDVIGVQGHYEQIAAVTVATGKAIGVQGIASTSAAGTISNLVAVNAKVLNAGGATVTNGIGLLIDDHSVGTNKYGVYQAGTGLVNRFESSLNILMSTAIPAGGTAGAGVKVSSTSNFGMFFGSGAPSLVAAKGSIYLRSDGTTTNDRAYIATDSAGNWTALTTAT